MLKRLPSLSKVSDEATGWTSVIPLIMRTIVSSGVRDVVEVVRWAYETVLCDVADL